MKISADDLFPYNFDNVLRDILEHKHTYYVFKGGRGSCKSSFVSIVIILLMTRKRIEISIVSYSEKQRTH